MQSSYAFNEAVLGWGDKGGQGGVADHYRCRGNLARIVHPSDVVLLADGSPRGLDGWMVYDDFYNTDTLFSMYVKNFTPGLANAQTAEFDVNRHRGYMSVLCCDGHAESTEIAESLTRPGGLQNFSIAVGFH
jgi:hypothetical protein